MSGWTRGHRPGQSSLSSLAHPLSPPLTLRLQSGFLLAGLSDSVQYRKAVESIQLDPVIQSAVTKCTLLQAFILVCVTGVDWLLLPAWTRGTASNGSGSGRQRMTEEQARFYFQIFWLYPLIGLSFLLSGSFFSNVASRASSADVPVVPSKVTGSSSPTHRSSLLSRILVIAVYLVTSAVLSRIPFLGRPLSLLYLSLISSYYCFEYRFISTYSLHSLRSRVVYLESRWPYFIGFGLPSTILSSCLFSSATLNLTIWSLLFPLYILMAAHSDPLPYDPTRPAKAHDLPGQESSDNRGTTKFASRNLNPEARLPEWWPNRIFVLYGAVLLDDVVSGFMRSFLRSGGGGAKKSAEGYTGPSSSSAYGGGGGAGTQYGTATYGGGPPSLANNSNNAAYAQRRDAFTSRNPAGNFGIPNGSTYSNAASAVANAAGGFARQADQYFGNLANGSTGAGAGGGGPYKPPAPKRERSENYGVGMAAGVATRREGVDASGVSSRRRGAGAGNS